MYERNILKCLIFVSGDCLVKWCLYLLFRYSYIVICGCMRFCLCYMLWLSKLICVFNLVVSFGCKLGGSVLILMERICNESLMVWMRFSKDESCNVICILVWVFD